MAITLAEAKVGMTNKVDQAVIDTFRRSSFLLDNLIFDDAISPGTGGSTLGYSYIQLKTPATAGTRSINSEYTPGEAKREEKNSKAIIMGGSYELDRVIIGTAGAVDELAFQQTEKIKATANEFHNLVINGNSASSGAGVLNTFDGLNKLLVGTASEVTSTIDVSTSAKLDTAANALCDELDEFLATLSEKPSMLLGNLKTITKIKGAARRLGYFTSTRDEFGRTVEKYNDIQLVDAGQYYNGSNLVDVIPVDGSTGKSDLYAVVIAQNGFHGISPTGNKVIQQYTPDLNAPGAVKKGEVELVAGVVLKDTTKAGVLRGIKVK